MTQKELTTDWIIGFVEGEGHFGVGIRILKDKTSLKTPRFDITQSISNASVLNRIQDFFGFGNINISNRTKKYSDGYNREPICRFAVRSLRDSIKLRDFFEGKLQTERKIRDFERWKQAIIVCSKQFNPNTPYKRTYIRSKEHMEKIWEGYRKWQKNIDLQQQDAELSKRLSVPERRKGSV